MRLTIVLECKAEVSSALALRIRMRLTKTIPTVPVLTPQTCAQRQTNGGTSRNRDLCTIHHNEPRKAEVSSA